MKHVLRFLPIVTLAFVVAWVAARPSAPLAQHTSKSRAKDALFYPDVVRTPKHSVLAHIRTELSKKNLDAAFQIAHAGIPKATAKERFALHWLGAEAARATGNDTQALEWLSRLAASEHPLNEWAKLRRVELLEVSDPRQAVKEAELLLGDWAGQARAQVLHARALAKTGPKAQALQELRVLVEQAPAERPAVEVLMPLARLLAQESAPQKRAEAVALLRRVVFELPKHNQALSAERLANDIVAGLPPILQKTFRKPTRQELWARSKALARALEYDKAVQQMAELRAKTLDDLPLQCELGLLWGQTLLRQKRRSEAAKVLDETKKSCQDADSNANLLFNAAKAQSGLDEDGKAIALYDEIANTLPQHRLADDALLRGASLARGLGDGAGTKARLERILTEHAQGDMVAEARFMLGWLARAEHDDEAALRYFEALHNEHTLETEEGLEGRAAYWSAQTRYRLGQPKEALAAYEELFLRYPLSYYAQQAWQRLHKDMPKRAQTLLKKLRSPISKERVSFKHSESTRNVSFRRFVDLLVVGEFGRAQDEWNWLRKKYPHEQSNLQWIVASLYYFAGAFDASIQLIRNDATMRTTFPSGTIQWQWRLAYPQAFAQEILQAAKKNSVPPAFVFAIAREESSFNPRAVSIARAYGLTQVIQPTAKKYGSEISKPFDVESLKNPEINTAIGVRYMAYLWKRYAKNPALVPAAYNAGEAALDRWLVERGDLPLDEWVEEIPYAETRRYTRRVLQSYGIYTWLYYRGLPDLTVALP